MLNERSFANRFMGWLKPFPAPNKVDESKGHIRGLDSGVLLLSLCVDVFLCRCITSSRSAVIQVSRVYFD